MRHFCLSSAVALMLVFSSDSAALAQQGSDQPTQPQGDCGRGLRIGGLTFSITGLVVTTVGALGVMRASDTWKIAMVAWALGITSLIVGTPMLAVGNRRRRHCGSNRTALRAASRDSLEVVTLVHRRMGIFVGESSPLRSVRSEEFVLDM